MKINRLVVPLLGVIFFGSVWAGAMGPDIKMDDWWLSEDACPVSKILSTSYPWEHVMTASIGPAYNHDNGKSQTFYLRSDVKKTFEATPSSNVLLYGELFLGMQKQLTSLFISQFGLSIAGSTDANLSGDIWESADPDFNNHTYSYSVNEARVTLTGKMFADINYYDLLPYASLDLGVGFNTAHGFTISPSIYKGVLPPNFGKNTETVFTYALGFGIQKKINDYWRTGIGYEFADWGSTLLAPAPGQTLNKGLMLSHIYISSLLLSITCAM